MQKIVELLTERNKTIATMESCTGGGLANAITNIPGASEVLKYSAITYSNEFKIKMGVPKETIDKYTVYSINTAEAMALAISEFTDANYGIGITGKLNRQDENNLVGENNKVYFSIYCKDTKKYYNTEMFVTKNNRKENKEEIIKEITNKLLTII